MKSARTGMKRKQSMNNINISFEDNFVRHLIYMVPHLGFFWTCLDRLTQEYLLFKLSSASKPLVTFNDNHNHTNLWINKSKWPLHKYELYTQQSKHRPRRFTFQPPHATSSLLVHFLRFVWCRSRLLSLNLCRRLFYVIIIISLGSIDSSLGFASVSSLKLYQWWA